VAAETGNLIRMRYCGTHKRQPKLVHQYSTLLIFCFQYKEDVNRFYKALKVRLEKFNLELSEEETKIVKLTDDQDNDGNRTFDFLGFTHYMGKCRDGIKRLKRKTSSKRFRKSISKYKR